MRPSPTGKAGTRSEASQTRPAPPLEGPGKRLRGFHASKRTRGHQSRENASEARTANLAPSSRTK